MNLIKAEKTEKSAMLLEFSVDKETFDKAVNKVYRQQVGKINVPGFRKGKAPRSVIERMYGKGIFWEDAANEVLPDAYEAALTESGVKPVGRAEFDITNIDDNGITFTATVPVKPAVEIEGYKGIEAAKVVEPATDVEIDNEIKIIRERNSRETEITDETPAANGDSTKIDFEGFVDGVAFEGGKGEDYNLKLGSGSFIPGFEEQVVGMNVGEEKDLNVTFPEDYGAAELAGAPVVFKVKVNEIKADVVPEIDDEFAKDVSEFETLEELKADLRAKVEKRKTDAAQSAFETAVMDKAIANAEMEVPDTMVEYELDRQMQNFEQRIAGYGMKLDQYLSMMGTNRQEFAENQRPGALRSIQQDLLLEAVVKAENIEASQEEKDAEVKRLSEEFGMEEDKVRAAVSEEQLAYGVQVQKASNVIVESAVAVAP